ncbi:hypothetical protein SAMN04489719_1068 [Agrococcus carbonis]|uniref:Uncharacterized protein n=1 Tax=Agrococcus carbonis TaxID=684552 RepID=A0A1H1MSD2_9MICO|nr:hypothetical protein SAMN04489719_1068 [Agrococcus carbonis]
MLARALAAMRHNRGVTELPWVIDTRGATRNRNPVWGVLGLAGAVLCGACFLIGMAVSWAELDALVVWLLPVWGIITLLALAFSITAAARRGTANLTMAAIAGGLLVISNPVVFLIIGFALGFLR